MSCLFFALGAEINIWLRSIYHHIDLGPDMLPARYDRLTVAA